MGATNTATIDDSKFPLTTQKGLSPQDQAMIDAINLDELREAVQLGEHLSERQKQRLQELETKDKIRKNGDNGTDQKPTQAIG